ncbi:hypothetical protein BU225_06785 [Stenotrophomonas sp. MB339]|nr:hypothetical protein BU225_06785 [Stenotrophomonas sp. MB339]
MDAAAKPPGTGLRRPPQPDPPRHPSGSPLLLWLRLVAGAGRSPASTTPSLLQEVVHQQMLHVVEAAVQYRLGCI